MESLIWGYPTSNFHLGPTIVHLNLATIHLGLATIHLDHATIHLGTAIVHTWSYHSPLGSCYYPFGHCHNPYMVLPPSIWGPSTIHLILPLSIWVDYHCPFVVHLGSSSLSYILKLSKPIINRLQLVLSTTRHGT